MCGIFEADVYTIHQQPHVTLSLHAGLLRCGLFEAKTARTSSIRLTTVPNNEDFSKDKLNYITSIQQTQ